MEKNQYYIFYFAKRENGFKLLAAYHEGALPFNCSICPERAKEENGCETPAQYAVWEDELIDGEQYYCCPLAFIPESVINWYENYSYDKEFGTTTSFNDRNNKFIEAIGIYNSYKSKWFQYMHPKKKDGLQRLKYG